MHSSDGNTPKRSALAIEIAALQESVNIAQEKRGTLPQPLFWSLFAHKIKALREKKELETILKEILD